MNKGAFVNKLDYVILASLEVDTHFNCNVVVGSDGIKQQVISSIRRLTHPDVIDLEADLGLIAVVGRGMKSTRGTAGRIFSALAHANINVKM